MPRSTSTVERGGVEGHSAHTPEQSVGDHE